MRRARTPEVDVIEPDPGRRLRLPAAAVGAALALLAAGQVAAVALPQALPEDVQLTVPKEAFGFTADADALTVSFQLRNDSQRVVRVTAAGQALPGLELVDVVASGSPVGFRAVGTGPGPLPAFWLAPDTAVLLAVTYRLTSCDDVPRAPRPVPVSVRDGRARGVVAVDLPQLPDDADGAADTDVVEWQQVLVRELCG